MNCKLCPNFIISRSVTFVAGTGLIINLPAGTYKDGCKYCIVIAQTKPAETTISAPVFITIGDGADQYPLVSSCCDQVSACSVHTRTKYATVVHTSTTGASFKLINKICCTADKPTGVDGGAAAAAN